MNKAVLIWLLLLVLSACMAPLTSMANEIDVEVLSPQNRVFQDMRFSTKKDARVNLWSGRNEYESVQIALYSANTAHVSKAEVTEFKAVVSEDGPLPSCQIKIPGYVYVKQNTRATPREELDGEAPGWYPDPLERFSPFEFKGARSLWLTCHTPEGVSPGAYHSQVKLVMAGRTRNIPITLNVWDYSIPKKSSLLVSQWLHPSQLEKHYKVRFGTEEYWSVIDKVASDMASHRHNVIFTRLNLVRVVRKADGNYEFDFNDYARWVRIFLSHGFEVFEGGPLFHPKSFNIRDGIKKKKRRLKKEGVMRFLESVEGMDYIKKFLAALHKENIRLGIEGDYIQHVGDEATKQEKELYKQVANIVRQAMPGVAIIDATHLDEKSRISMMDVPVTNMANTEASHSNELGKRWGKWWYTAGFKPRGKMPNRFIDYPLYKIRMLAWLSWKYQMSGYLHYGYNWWQLPSGASPWDQVQYKNYSAGDAWIVYPDRSGEKSGPVASMRWETFRDGLEDLELFVMLENWRQALDGLPNVTKRDSLVQESISDLNDILLSISSHVKSKTEYPRSSRLVDEIRYKAGSYLSELNVSFQCAGVLPVECAQSWSAQK